MASKCASKTLFVGNLHASLEETDLLEIFRPFGRIVECCKRWCHYGFIQFATEDEAKVAFNNLNGSRVRGRPMRIEFQRKKIRNLAALLEAEAQSKIKQVGGSSSGTCSGAATDERDSPALFTDDDLENIAPSYQQQQLSFAQLFNTQQKQQQQQQLFLLTENDNAKYSTFDFDLLTKQLSFLDSDSNSNSSSKSSSSKSDLLINTQQQQQQPLNVIGRKITNSSNIMHNSSSNPNIIGQQPLATRNLNVSTQKTSLPDCTFAKEIATNVLTSQSVAKIPTAMKQSSSEHEIDAKSSAWFNYLLDKAAKYPSKTKAAATFSLSSSPLSPSQRENDCHKSNSIENSLNSNSVILYRSLNTSNTIFVQPTDILEPLEVGDFNEYKLFPTSNSCFNSKCLSMSSPNNQKLVIDCDYAKQIEILVELTPPSSVSLSSASSIASSTSSSSSFNRHQDLINNKTSPISSYRRNHHTKC